MAQDLDAGERVPAALVVLAPGAADLEIEPHVLGALRAAALDQTSLDVVSAISLGVPAGALAGCPPQRLLGCAVGVMEARGARAQLLIVVSALSLGDGLAQIRALAIDLARAREAVEAAGAGDDALENQLYSRAYESPIVELSTRDERAMRAYAAEITAAMRVAIPLALPLGAVSLDLQTRGELSLDDRSLGPVERGSLTLSNVRPGSRLLRVLDPLGAVLERGLEVKSGRTTRVGLEIVKPTDLEPWATTRTVVKWGGASVAAAGAAFLVVAATNGSGVREGCLLREGGTDASCAGLGAPSFGFDASATPSTRATAVDPGGLRPLALGAALLSAGAVWCAGTLLLGDDTDHPWWIVGSGAVAGALVLGAVSAGAN